MPANVDKTGSILLQSICKTLQKIMSKFNFTYPFMLSCLIKLQLATDADRFLDISTNLPHPIILTLRPLCRPLYSVLLSVSYLISVIVIVLRDAE